ncbi:hypothetical protein EUGRSUZ_G01059 [Eucalyptus grandis]|uniref:Uncharacterized protein n=2 Tax=Eucalyptus grandis TaxID=71139 RepID=A0ACC3K1R1_EUCGR|nr:hypothetical protein EUGRSUZ_G01059 [Eucalyptus grandis]
MKLLMENRVQLFLSHLLQLLQRGLQSPNNSSSSPIHQFTNIGSLSGYDFSMDNSLSDKSIEMKSSHGTTKEDEWIDPMPDADLCDAKGKKGKEPRFEMVQTENEDRNIEDEAKDERVDATPAADLSQTKGKKGKEPRFEMVRNIEDEAAARAKLLQRGLQSPNNSSISPIHQFTNIGSLSGYDFSLDNSLSDKSIEMKSSLGSTKEDERVDATPAADLSQTKGKKGKEPRFEMVRNIEDEAAARAKNGQTSITENRRTKIEPPNRVDPLEEAEGTLPSTFSSGFMDFSQFSSFFDEDEPAAQAKGLEHEEHDLAGNSPKRRRLDLSEENQIQ